MAMRRVWLPADPMPRRKPAATRLPRFYRVAAADAGEDFKGCLVPLLGGLLKDTEKGFVDFNQGLKRAAEGKK